MVPSVRLMEGDRVGVPRAVARESQGQFGKLRLTVRTRQAGHCEMEAQGGSSIAGDGASTSKRRCVVSLAGPQDSQGGAKNSCCKELVGCQVCVETRRRFDSDQQGESGIRLRKKRALRCLCRGTLPEPASTGVCTAWAGLVRAGQGRASLKAGQGRDSGRGSALATGAVVGCG